LVDMLSTYTVLKSAPNRTAAVGRVTAAIQARLTRVGTGMKLIDDSGPIYCGYCMASTDVNQVRLILVIASNTDLATAWAVDNVKGLVQGAVGMMKRGSWDLTVADAYGVLAMKAFSQTFEKDPVTGVTTVTFPGVTKSMDWSANPKGGALGFDWITGQANYSVALNHSGTGKPWAIVAMNAAVPLAAKVENHINLSKILSPQQAVYKVGDVITVTLTVKAQTGLSQVSLMDPIPAGAKIQGTGLDNDASQGPTTGAYMYPDDESLANDGYHASYGAIPAQEFTVVYRMRLNNAGTFKIPTTRVEAIYAPENFAELPNSDITVVQP
jgi:hypothetical protein